MNVMVSKRQIFFDEIAALHMNDLFDGSEFAPARLRRGRGLKKGRKSVRRKHREEPIKKIAPPKEFDRISCPCCAQRVETPTLDIVIDHYGVTPTEAQILSAVWKGKGMPVSTERIFDAMYVDDPDGGPSPTAMYRAFKVALCHLRKRLEGSGVTVENVGYRMGYRLVLGSK